MNAAPIETDEERAKSEDAYRAWLREAAKTTAFATPTDQMVEQPGDYTDEDE